MTTRVQNVGERIAEGWLAALLVLAPWPYGSTTDVARFTLAAGLALGSAAMWLFADRAALRPPLWGLLGALPCLAAVQIALGTSAAPVWTAEAGLLAATMAAALLAWLAIASDGARRLRLAWVVLAAAAVQALFAIVQWSHDPHSIYGRTSPIVTTPFGSFVNHNHFAGLMAMAVPLALGMASGFWRRAGGPTPVVAALGGVALFLTSAHLASRSRGGLIALVAGLAFLGAAWVSIRGATKRRGAWLMLGMALLAVVAFGWAAIPRSARAHLLTVFHAPTADSSGIYRLDMAVASLRLAGSSPFMGIGLGAYADAVTAFKRGHGSVRTTHAESDVLELLAEGGGAAVIVVAGMLWVLLPLAVGGLKERGDPVGRGIRLGALGGIGALAAHALIDFNLRVPANALVFVALVALAAAPRSTTADVDRGRAALALVCVCLALGTMATWRAVGAWQLEEAGKRPTATARLDALSRLLDAHPYLAQGWRSRAHARLAQPLAAKTVGRRRIEGAGRDLRQALRLRPRWGEARGDLASVLAALGDIEGARREMARALLDDPTHPGLQQLRQRLARSTTTLPDRP